MALFDFPLEKLQEYNPPETAPGDFDAFWSATLAQTAAATGKSAARFEPVNESIFEHIVAHDVTFPGYLGQPIKGWFLHPRKHEGSCHAWCITSATAAGAGWRGNMSPGRSRGSRRSSWTRAGKARAGTPAPLPMTPRPPARGRRYPVS